MTALICAGSHPNLRWICSLICTGCAREFAPRPRVNPTVVWDMHLNLHLICTLICAGYAGREDMQHSALLSESVGMCMPVWNLAFTKQNLGFTKQNRRSPGPEARSQKPKAKSQKPEAKCRKKSPPKTGTNPLKIPRPTHSLTRAIFVKHHDSKRCALADRLGKKP